MAKEHEDARAKATAATQPVKSAAQVFASGTFKGVDVHDTFALAGMAEITIDIGSISWPGNLKPRR